MAWQLQIAGSKKAAEVEFSVPLQGEEWDVNLSWLPLHLALGQHAQSVHAVTALTGLVTLPTSRPKPKKINGSSPAFLLLRYSLF